MCELPSCDTSLTSYEQAGWFIEHSKIGRVIQHENWMHYALITVNVSSALLFSKPGFMARLHLWDAIFMFIKAI